MSEPDAERYEGLSPSQRSMLREEFATILPEAKALAFRLRQAGLWEPGDDAEGGMEIMGLHMSREVQDTVQ